jgi:two-component system, chemotaxis family, chemotaxis protein CheY
VPEPSQEKVVKHCLVVDDSRVIRKIACNILSALEFDTTEAEDGAEALDACRSNMPDVILLASQMRRMSGVEFLRSLRRQDRGDHPFVLLCTTENDVSKLSEALNAGANQYLMKPFDQESLTEKLSLAGVV